MTIERNKVDAEADRSGAPELDGRCLCPEERVIKLSFTIGKDGA